MFFKMLSYDIYRGIWRKKYLFLPLFVLTIIFCQSFYYDMQSYQMMGICMESGSWMDYIALLFQGMKEYIPSPDNPFVFPVMWILIFLYVAYISLGYLHDDLTASGQQVLIRSGGRKLWWISKCLWNVAITMLSFMVMYLSVTVYCLIRGIQLSFSCTTSVLEYQLEMPILSSISVWQGICVLILMPLGVALALNLFQMFLGLLIMPWYSCGMIAAILLISAYFKSPLLIGNYSMFYRSAVLIGEESGMQLIIGALLTLVFVAVAVMGGLFLFSKHDILNQE